MQFFVYQLQQIGMVLLIMACALVGTVGIIKLIRGVFHVDNMNFSDNRRHTEEKRGSDTEQ